MRSWKRDKLIQMQSNHDMDAQTIAVGQRIAFPLGEFAALIGVSAQTVRRMGRRGDIALVHIGKRPFVPRQELERLLHPTGVAEGAQ